MINNVRELLINYPLTRDDNNELIRKYLHLYWVKSPAQYASIIRTRAYLQQHFESLRGDKYQERQKYSKTKAKEFKVRNLGQIDSRLKNKNFNPMFEEKKSHFDDETKELIKNSKTVQDLWEDFIKWMNNWVVKSILQQEKLKLQELEEKYASVEEKSAGAKEEAKEKKWYNLFWLFN